MARPKPFTTNNSIEKVVIENEEEFKEITESNILEKVLEKLKDNRPQGVALIMVNINLKKWVEGI